MRGRAKSGSSNLGRKPLKNPVASAMLGPLFSAAEMQIAHVFRKICPPCGKNTAEDFTSKLAEEVPVFYYPHCDELKTCIEF